MTTPRFTPKVLFLCTHNSARSQLSEALLRHHAPGRFAVHSAGLEPGDVHPLTLTVLEERGVNTEGLHAKPLKSLLGREHFHYLITVCARAEQNCPVFPGVSTRLSWPFEDPANATGTADERLAAFRRVRDEIEGQLVSWLHERLEREVRA